MMIVIRFAAEITYRKVQNSNLVISRSVKIDLRLKYFPYSILAMIKISPFTCHYKRSYFFFVGYAFVYFNALSELEDWFSLRKKYWNLEEKCHQGCIF